MATPVIMPKQGQSVESCIITSWNKKKGDSIKKGEILFTYETDKASFEKEAEDDGILLEIFFNEGDEVPVLQNVAVIGKAGEKTDEFKPAENNGKTEIPTTVATEKETNNTNNNVTNQTHDTFIASDEIKISPRAKKLAEKLGVPVQYIRGTGPDGRIIEQDIENYRISGGRMTPLAGEIISETGKQAPSIGTGIGGNIRSFDLSEKISGTFTTGSDSEIKKISNMRKIIAEKMLFSMQNSAQLTHHISADARAILSLREKIKPQAEKGLLPNITLNDMVCFAVIRALKKQPEANGHFLGDSIRLFKKVHLGIAVDTPRGLMVPALRNADDLTLPQLATNLKELANQCKDGKINPELLSSEAASFTISNLGAFGIEMFTPVLNVPQIGILGVNTISLKPKDLGNAVIGFVPHIGLSLTYDHRALDGAPASIFLREIKNEIENLSFTF